LNGVNKNKRKHSINNTEENNSGILQEFVVHLDIVTFISQKKKRL